MSADCVFCKIVAGTIPAARVDEDPSALAFLDVQPLREGHVLVIPKRHAARVEDLTSDEAAAVMRLIHRVAPKACRTVQAPASTIAFNNGREAGQEVPHVHAHIVPRRAGDAAGPIHALFRDRPATTPTALAALAERMRRA